MDKCLILFDIDETLYQNNEKRIPDSTLVALDRLHKAGHTLAIATGRPLFELVEAIKEVPFDLFILANGQMVIRNDEIIYENAIDKTIIDDLLVQAHAAGVYLGFSSATHASVTGITPELEVAFAKYYATMPRVAPNTDEHESVHQIWYLSEDITAISEQFSDRLKFLPWLTNGADVVPAGSSKAVGLTEALAVLADVLPAKIVFFGDGLNDLELMAMADVGIAMGNAVEPLKAVADFVTKNIEDDGIYYACEQLELFGATVEGQIADLVDLIATEPDVLEHYLDLKALYSGYTRESEKGIQVLEAALERFPEDVVLLLELAATYEFELEDFDMAKMYYQRVLAIDPEQDLALDALAVINERSVYQ